MGESNVSPPIGKRAANAAERRAAIVKVARRHFRDHGYGGSTMSAIAAALGGSKGTLWAYFPTKEDLFAASVDSLVGEFATAVALPRDADLRLTLTRYATEFLGMLLSPPVEALQRLIIAEAPRFPELGRIFYDRGPRKRQGALADYFADQIAAGRLRPIEPLTASAQFHLLCQHHLGIRRLWGIAEPETQEAIAADARATVALFLDGCGQFRASQNDEPAGTSCGSSHSQPRTGG